MALSFPNKAFAEWHDANEFCFWINGSDASSLSIPELGSGSGYGIPKAVSGTTRQSASWSSVPSNATPVLVTYVTSVGTSYAQGVHIKVESNSGGHNFSQYYYSDTSHTQSQVLNPYNPRYFVFDTNRQNRTEIYPDNDGTLVMPFDVGYIAVTVNVVLNTSVLPGPENKWGVTNSIEIFNWVAEDIDEVSAINNQTTQLNSTTGSNTVAGDTLETGYEIVDDLGFVSQTASFVSGAYDAVMNSDASASLAFPGLTIMGHTIISPQNVPFLGYLGSEIENTIRTACTMVLAIAWINGLMALYRKIFIGETVVEVDE